MRFSTAVLAACATSANAFKDTSPFLLFSSSPLPKELEQTSTPQLQSSASIITTTHQFLKNCPSDLYYIISQPSLSSSDLSSSNTVPHLKKTLTNPNVHTRFSVSEVTGLKNVSVEDLIREIDTNCGGVLGFDDAKDGKWKGALKSGKKVVVTSLFGELPTEIEERGEVLADNDATMYSQILKDLAKGYSYTVIYLTTPPPVYPTQSPTEILVYQPEFENLAHIDLKRDLRVEDRGLNNTDFRPLFEKYQYLTPGLFMGLLVGLILVSILSVGLSAISSLKVSYGAFDKEMGPAAQKKQQ